MFNHKHDFFFLMENWKKFPFHTKRRNNRAQIRKRLHQIIPKNLLNTWGRGSFPNFGLANVWVALLPSCFRWWKVQWLKELDTDLMSSRMWPSSPPASNEDKTRIIDNASDSKMAWLICISGAKSTPWRSTNASVTSALRLAGRTLLRAPIATPKESLMITPMQEQPPPSFVAPLTLILWKPGGGAAQRRLA